MRRTALLATVFSAAAVGVLGAPAAHAEGKGDIRVTKTVVNNGGNVIVGVHDVKTFPVTFTVKDNSGVKGVSHVSVFNSKNGYDSGDWTGNTCHKSSSTTSVCTETFEVHPAWLKSSVDIDPNELAGTWQVNATVQAKDGDYWIHDSLAHFDFKRASTLTADATPEPVAKGGKLTVMGKLARANWNDLKYHGYTKQNVKLQFKKAGASAYTTVKTVRTSSTGTLSTTVTATASGTWRWDFSGTHTTMAITSAGDTVKLR
ncbi:MULTISPECIES: hypothetical protein [unclassified Streptomyces]|uniref:hypothetical protein n=1 Tax=unclassified Streptomyces TaxID=2593676 RepID=UPI002E0FCF74|nr:hypothetical protein OG452_10355 [Streptomyces sp. NBC_01197]WSS51614.1 hypothetical protein OG708_25025 [Streptomyces sp. NBC_01180]